MKKNEKGFGAIALLAVFVIAIVLVGGVFLYQRNHKKSGTSAKSTTTVDTSHPPTPPNQPPTNQKYLTIKEWDIKLPLDPTIADAYYVVSTNSQTNGQPNTMWLGLKSLDGTACAAAQANSGGAYPLGAIIKALPDETDPVSGAPIKQRDPNGVTINGYYYAYHSGIQGNSSTRCVAKASITNADAIDAAFANEAKAIVSQ